MVSAKNITFIIIVFLLPGLTGNCTFKKDKRLTMRPGDKVNGKVISVIDGDTYDILVNGSKTLRVRMEGIDAPERGMPFYRVSKNHLSEYCFNKDVKLEITGVDDFNRILGYTYLDDGTELGREMVRSGLAWHFKRYNSDPTLARLETEARTQKKGIWSQENPMPPWINRSLRRKGISTKDSFSINGNER